MGDPLPFPTEPAPPARRLAPLAWALTALVVAAAVLLAGWQFIERRGTEDDLEGSRQRVASLEQEVEALERRIAEVEATLEEERGTVATCRDALESLARAWDALVGSLNAADRLDRTEVARFRERANRNRERAADAASRCG